MTTAYMIARIRLNTQVDQFPVSWQGRLRRALGAINNIPDVERWSERIGKLVDVGRGGLRPDASDADICNQADLTASDFARRLAQVKAIVQGAPAARRRPDVGPQWVGVGWLVRPVKRAAEVVVRAQALYCRYLLAGRGLLDMWPGNENRAGDVLRMQCARFWRRCYRKLHARTVEACAIDLGMVRSTAGLYASDDAVRRRGAQNARNAAALESVVAVNENGQDYTLAELAAKGTANKSIRRVELLTRIAGFEMIAKDCGHAGYMVTVSCPSRFHKTTTRRDGRVIDNPKWDGSTPNDAQKYLSGQWAKCRAAASRAGFEWYGFRIAEPQQDGTPHWHSLLFMRGEATSGERLLLLVRRYFLENESPNEPGAQKHRIDIEPIDWRKGSAVGYVIKYVSKNIDGHGVGLDLFGNDAITSSQRVEAWASTWRIRQFQQIGGAPVGVWRELRRVNPDNLGGSVGVLAEALTAVNVAKTEPGVQAIAWKRYTLLQGGVACKRKSLRVRLLKEQTGEFGRYGDVMPGRAKGVEADGVECFRNHIHAMLPNHPAFERRVAVTVESERSEWLIRQGGRDAAIAAAAVVFQRIGAAERTRIHVNNCTQPDYSQRSEFAPVSRRVPKIGRVAHREAPV